MSKKQVKITATVKDDQGNEVIRDLQLYIDDVEGNTFCIDFEYTKAPVNGGPIVMPKPPRM